jgi:protein-S-isoprenylcysteine O-methyltransferase Ste14
VQASPPQTQRIGRALFSIRSFTPVPVVALILAFLYWDRNAVRLIGPAADRLLDVFGFAIAFCGQALRAWVLGQVPPRTSGQGNELEASTLNTRGPYARVRNPLYLGNFLIVSALLLIADNPWVWLIGIGFFAIQYAFIVRAEEAFLRAKFGAAFDSYAADVPRWLPRWTAATQEPLSPDFDARRALFKEHNPFAAWMSGALALTAWKAWSVRGVDARWELGAIAAAEVLLLVAFATVKAWKHGRFDARRQA